VHLSCPNLEPLPGNRDFLPFIKLLKSENYNGWIVVEMLSQSGDEVEEIRRSLNWLLSSLKTVD